GHRRCEYEWQGVQADLAPIGPRDVNRKNKTAARSQEPMDLAQQCVVCVGCPTLAWRVRFGVLDSKSRNDAVEVLALPRCQPSAEVRLNKSDAPFHVRRIGFGPQSLDSAGVDCRAVKGHNFREPAPAFFPKRACQFATAAA